LRYNEMEDIVNEFDAWLNDMSTKPLPGGIAAAAVAASMGAALMAKALRVTLKRGSLAETDRAFLASARGLAQAQVAGLVELAEADEQAFRAVLDLAPGQAESAASRQKWLEATTVPVRLAEACQSLLEGFARLLALCWPAVYPDLETGGWLLEVGLKAGLLSSESNLHLMEESADAAALQRRMQRLQNGRDD